MASLCALRELRRRTCHCVGRRAVACSPAPSRPLPVVDISAYMAGGADRAAGGGARASTARAFEAACRDPGFFYLTGHGVPEADIDGLHALAKRFFALPASSKEAIALSHRAESGRGYQRLGENVTQGRRDWHEAIDFYAEVDERSVDLDAFRRPPSTLGEGDVSRLRPLALGRNVWPAEPAGFRAAAETHFARMAGVGAALMSVMADALSLPSGYFQTLTDRSFWGARIIGYPPLQNASLDVGLVGASCGEHTDYGCWTILAQDSTPGALQVRQSDGSWMTVDPLPGAFVVNLGDMLSVWTRRRFSATPHLVRQTTRDRYRTSVAFFYEPNFDAVIKPLAGLDGETKVADAAAGPTGLVGATAPLLRAMDGGSLVYGEHLFAKVSGNFDFAANR